MTAEFQVGDTVRVIAEKASRRWVQRGVIEKVSNIALMALVRYSDGTSEWIPFTRLQETT